LVHGQKAAGGDHQQKSPCDGNNNGRPRVRLKDVQGDHQQNDRHPEGTQPEDKNEKTGYVSACQSKEIVNLS
jgi:hypothetical protein